MLSRFASILEPKNDDFYIKFINFIMMKNLTLYFLNIEKLKID